MDDSMWGSFARGEPRDWGAGDVARLLLEWPEWGVSLRFLLWIAPQMRWETLEDPRNHSSPYEVAGVLVQVAIAMIASGHHRGAKPDLWEARKARLRGAIESLGELGCGDPLTRYRRQGVRFAHGHGLAAMVTGQQARIEAALGRLPVPLDTVLSHRAASTVDSRRTGPTTLPDPAVDLDAIVARVEAALASDDAFHFIREDYMAAFQRGCVDLARDAIAAAAADRLLDPAGPSSLVDEWSLIVHHPDLLPPGERFERADDAAGWVLLDATDPIWERAAALDPGAIAAAASVLAEARLDRGRGALPANTERVLVRRCWAAIEAVPSASLDGLRELCRSSGLLPPVEPDGPAVASL